MATWGFLLWGSDHGAALVLDHVRGGGLRPPAWLAWLVVFHVVVLAWIPFRAPDLDLAGAFLARLGASGDATLWSPAAVLAVLAVIGLQLVPERPLDALRLRLEALNPAAMGVGLAVTIFLVASTIPGQGVPPFIYFQF